MVGAAGHGAGGGFVVTAVEHYRKRAASAARSGGLVLALCIGAALSQAHELVPPSVSAQAGRLDEHSACASTGAEVMDAEDCRRSAARAYPLQGIRSIHVKGSTVYRDADGRTCTRGGVRLTSARIRFAPQNAVPVSANAVMNYYGEFGECVSGPALVTLVDGRKVHIALSSQSKVLYLSPLLGGREVDVYFYFCEACNW